MEANLEYANMALMSVCQYKQLSGKNFQPYKQNLRQFGLEDSDLVDLITSTLHLAQQLQNEGQDIDPEQVWNSAWMHFDAEVLHPDDIEQDQRRMRKNRK